jgi:hypothetical protein
MHTSLTYWAAYITSIYLTLAYSRHGWEGHIKIELKEIR